MLPRCLPHTTCTKSRSRSLPTTNVSLLWCHQSPLLMSTLKLAPRPLENATTIHHVTISGSESCGTREAPHTWTWSLLKPPPISLRHPPYRASAMGLRCRPSLPARPSLDQVVAVGSQPRAGGLYNHLVQRRWFTLTSVTLAHSVLLCCNLKAQQWFSDANWDAIWVLNEWDIKSRPKMMYSINQIYVWFITQYI